MSGHVGQEELYSTAGQVLELVQGRKGTVKSLCLARGKTPQQKRKLYALVCETLKCMSQLVLICRVKQTPGLRSVYSRRSNVCHRFQIFRSNRPPILKISLFATFKGCHSFLIFRVKQTPIYDDAQMYVVAFRYLGSTDPRFKISLVETLKCMLQHHSDI